MSEVMEKPKKGALPPGTMTAIAAYEKQGEIIARAEERLWHLERISIPPLSRRVAMGDESIRAELKSLRAEVEDLRQTIVDAEQVHAELEDFVYTERQVLRAKEVACDFGKVRKIALEQRLAKAQQISDLVEALFPLMKEHDELQNQERAIAFLHMTPDQCQVIPLRSAAQLVTSRLGYLQLLLNVSNTHFVDSRTVAELAKVNIEQWLERLT